MPNVLVVDDELADRRNQQPGVVEQRNLIENAIGSNGFRPLWAPDPATAIAMIRREPRPSLVFLDLIMNGHAGGMEVFRYLVDQKIGNIPVVVLSSWGAGAKRKKDRNVPDNIPDVAELNRFPGVLWWISKPEYLKEGRRQFLRNLVGSWVNNMPNDNKKLLLHCENRTLQVFEEVGRRGEEHPCGERYLFRGVTQKWSNAGDYLSPETADDAIPVVDALFFFIFRLVQAHGQGRGLRIDEVFPGYSKWDRDSIPVRTNRSNNLNRRRAELRTAVLLSSEAKLTPTWLKEGRGEWSLNAERCDLQAVPPSSIVCGRRLSR